MSTKTTQLDWREGRRQRAWELKQQGWKQQDIAAALGVTPAPSASGSSGDASGGWRGCGAILPLGRSQAHRRAARAAAHAPGAAGPRRTAFAGRSGPAGAWPR